MRNTLNAKSKTKLLDLLDGKEVDDIIGAKEGNPFEKAGDSEVDDKPRDISFWPSSGAGEDIVATIAVMDVPPSITEESSFNDRADDDLDDLH